MIDAHSPYSRLTARLLLLAAMLVAVPLAAQDSSRTGSADSARVVTIGVQVRVRSEIDHRGVLADDGVLVHLLRSRLRATARPLAGITAVVEIQDARYWGQSNPALGRGTSDADADQLDMHQAWAAIDSVGGVPVSLRVGRQEMSFANERLIGVSNWSNTGRAFDAARATLRFDRASVDLFAARLTAPNPGPIASQNLYGLWGAWKPSSVLAVDLFGLRDDNTTHVRRGEDTGHAVLERYTAGTWLRASAGIVDVELEGALQAGRAATTDSSARKTIGAFMASATLAATVDSATRARLFGLVTALSGDGSTDDDRTENFNTLFGTNHRVYGQMDIVPETTGGTAGLVDVAIGASAVPVKGLRLLLEVHRLAPQRGAGTFGAELDLIGSWRASPALEVSGGGGVFRPGRLLESRFGTDLLYWAYLMAQLDF
jgi:hypothetical protein